MFCPQAIDAKTIKDVCTKYIYDKCPAIAAVGTSPQPQSQRNKEEYIQWFDLSQFRL